MKLTKRNKTIVAVIAIALTTIVIISVNSGVVSNPPVTGEVEVPLQVKQIFERACFSCHSNKTNLSWFDKLPVVSSIVAHDVTEARKRFNFSEWDKLSPVDKKATLWEIYNMVNAGKMPLSSYTAIHPEARVSTADLSILKDYLNTLKVTHINDTAMAHEAIIQRLQWQKQQAAVDTQHVSVNGIKHMPDYRNWQVMSTTSRFDNGTMRIMYANPIAYQAIKDRHINPWPNGSVIAKVVWEKQEDSEGNVHPGKFVNIQYMVRDSDKYKDTEGWGFARFDTPELKPYGTILSFKKCIACHQAVKKTGFVFDLSTKN
jgi:cytochrome c2